MKVSRRALFQTASRVAPLAWLRSLPAAEVTSRYPTVHVLGPDELAIVWGTAVGGDPTVVYSAHADLRDPVVVAASTAGLSVLATGLDRPLFLHRAVLKGLRPGTRCYYRTFLNGDEEPPLGTAAPSFVAPAAGSGFRFLVVGDSGTGSIEQQQVARQMAAEQNVSLLLHTGDIAYESGNFSNYLSKFFDVYRGQLLRVPFAGCLGNHDIQEDLGRSCTTLFPFPVVPRPAPWGVYYSLDWGDVHFVCLESNFFGRPEAEPMYEWLDADLAANRKLWTVAFFHHPPYDAIRGEEIQARAARERVVPLLDKHGVNLVLCGHHHGYVRLQPLAGGHRVEPGRGVLYVTSGGGGAGLHGDAPLEIAAVSRSVHHHLRVDVLPGRLEVRAISSDGTEIDRAVVVRPPTLGQRSIVNAANFEVAVAAGSIVSIFGHHLAQGHETAPKGVLPSELAGVRLTADDEPLPLFFVSPSQVNAQLPFGSSGRTRLRLRTSYGTAETELQVYATAPGIFLMNGRPETPAIVRRDGAPVSPTTPAARGDVLSIYATGLGKPKRALPAGQPAPNGALHDVDCAVTVFFDGTAVAPLFAGLAPGYAGLYQINVQVPETASDGVRNVWLVAGGVASNIVQVTVL